MNTLTISSKGQIKLSNELLQHLGVHSGEKICIERVPGGEIRIRAAKNSRRISDVFGMFKHEAAPVSIEEMNGAIAEGWAGEP